MNLTLS